MKRTLSCVVVILTIVLLAGLLGGCSTEKEVLLLDENGDMFSV